MTELNPLRDRLNEIVSTKAAERVQERETLENRMAAREATGGIRLACEEFR